MKRLLPLLTVALAAIGIAAAPANAASSTSTSSNWSGYVVSQAGTTYTDVKGSWIQPAATCLARSNAYSSFWVGLGGSPSTSTGLEQIGTSADCQSGHPA